MLQLEVIQESWMSPVILIPKMDQMTGFCVNYEKLNANSTAGAYLMPRNSELSNKLAAACYLTIMDLSRSMG